MSHDLYLEYFGRDVLLDVETGEEGKVCYWWNRCHVASTLKILVEMFFLTRTLRGEGLLLVELMSHDLYLEYLGRDVLLYVETGEEGKVCYW
jgi:hypothetical protein